MVALAFAERYPALVERLVVIGAAHRTDVLTTAWRVIQRRTVELGLTTGHAHEALVLARELAMTTYRSRRELAERFDAAPRITRGDVQFPVEEYLHHHGEKFARRFTASRFLALSLSSDLHRVDPARIATPTTLVAEEGDLVVPRVHVEELAALLGGPCDLVDLPSVHGHDAFLTEPERLGAILEHALSTVSLT
jgi:homoserine O-acetyltransferase